MKRRAVFMSLILVGAVLILTGCDASTPSRVETGKMRIVEETVTKTMRANAVEPPRIKAIADHYAANSKGLLALTVSYNEKDAKGKLRAEKQIKDFRAAFKNQGVVEIKAETVAVDEIYAGQAVVSYRALVAKPPKGCGRIVGYQGAERVADVDYYQFGCENAAALSRMISRTEDLKGNAGSQSGDGRRMGTTVEPYASGTPNDPIGGFTASDIGLNSGG